SSRRRPRQSKKPQRRKAPQLNHLKGLTGELAAGGVGPPAREGGRAPELVSYFPVLGRAPTGESLRPPSRGEHPRASVLRSPSSGYRPTGELTACPAPGAAHYFSRSSSAFCA